MDAAEQLAIHFMDQVLANAPEDFREHVVRFVVSIPTGTLCTGESIRLACIAQGIVPHHHNAWGGVISRCVRAGLLTETGRFPRMKSLSSHARRNPEYVRS
jgi:hypothetical protein